MNDIFLSYKSEDRPRAKIIAEAFEKKGFSIMWDEKIPPGKAYDKFIQEAIDASKCVVVLWSKESVKLEEGEWVRIEASEGKRRGILVPILIDDVTPPLAFRLKEAAKLFEWDGTSNPEFDLLLNSVVELVGQPAEQENEIMRPSAPVATPTVSESPEKTIPRRPVQVPKYQGDNEMVLTLRTGKEILLVRIPAGEFLMGNERKNVYLDEYWIGKYPVTNWQYQVFVEATRRGKKPSHWQDNTILEGKENHPVVYVSLSDASAFCAWVSQISDVEVRLPTETEWEKAARGADGRKYPWGNKNPDPTINNRFCNNGFIGDTTPVGKYSPDGDSQYGCADMAGNVWEWTSDKYDEEKYVIRGAGYFAWAGMSGSCTDRCDWGPNGSEDVGFRVIVSNANEINGKKKFQPS